MDVINKAVAAVVMTRPPRGPRTRTGPEIFTEKTDNLSQTVEITVHLLEPLRRTTHLDHVFFAEALTAPEAHSASAVGVAEM